MPYELERCFLQPQFPKVQRTCVTLTPESWEKIDRKCHHRAEEKRQGCEKGNIKDVRDDLCRLRFLSCQASQEHYKCQEQFTFCTQSSSNSCQLKNFKDECYLDWLKNDQQQKN